MKNVRNRPADGLPPEVTAAPPEFGADAPEIFAPPEEFGAGGEIPSRRQKKRRFMRIMAIPAVLLLAYLCIYAGGALPTRPDTPDKTEPASLSPETQNADAETEAQTEPEPETEPAAPYPLRDGEMLITVYSGTLDAAYEPEILLQERVSELTFTGMEIAAPEDIDAFSFYGYVIHIGNPWLRPAEEPPGTQRTVIPIGLTLTREAVEKTPVASDGVRYVDIYANWISDTDPATSDQTFTLDDGMGHVKEFDGSNPMYSEGFLYITAYPETERAGYIFDGWYNADGERVDLLQSFMSFFEPNAFDENGNAIDVDMNKPVQIALKARWRTAE